MKSRFLAAFVLFQFLNVQVQTAFATEAMQDIARAQSPEIQSAVQRIQNRLATLLESKTERMQLRIAFAVYKLDVRARNRTFLKSDEEIQAQVEQTDATLQEQDEISEPALQTLIDESKQKEVVAPVGVDLSKRMLKRERILQNSDPVLIALGSNVKSDGRLTRASFKTFQDRVYGLKDSNDSRAPASVGGVILKVLLSLILLAVGVGIIILTVLVIALSAFDSGPGISIWYLYAVIGAVGIGEFFGIRGIIRA